MPTQELPSGPVTYEQCERMVALAEKWLLEYFSDGLPRRPGDLEDDFAGKPGLFEMMSNIQGRWRSTPFYPALGRLVSAEKILFETDSEGDVWYAIPGCLPSQQSLSTCNKCGKETNMQQCPSCGRWNTPNKTKRRFRRHTEKCANQQRAPLKTEQANNASLQNSGEMGRPRRKMSNGLMQVLLVGAALGAYGLPVAERHEEPREEPREETDTDRWYKERAEQRRAGRLQKRQENQRRADAGKRPTMRTEPIRDSNWR